MCVEHNFLNPSNPFLQFFHVTFIALNLETLHTFLKINNVPANKITSHSEILQSQFCYKAIVAFLPDLEL